LSRQIANNPQNRAADFQSAALFVETTQKQTNVIFSFPGIENAFRCAADFALSPGPGISEHPGPMPTPSIDVRYVADLARLDLDEEEVRTFQGQLGTILEYIEKLGELDLEGIEPTAHSSPVFDRLDADEPRPGLESAALLDNAPDQASGQVRVPKVVADA